MYLSLIPQLPIFGSCPPNLCKEGNRSGLVSFIYVINVNIVRLLYSAVYLVCRNIYVLTLDVDLDLE